MGWKTSLGTIAVIGVGAFVAYYWLTGQGIKAETTGNIPQNPLFPYVEGNPVAPQSPLQIPSPLQPQTNLPTMDILSYFKPKTSTGDGFPAGNYLGVTTYKNNVPTYPTNQSAIKNVTQTLLSGQSVYTNTTAGASQAMFNALTTGSTTRAPILNTSAPKTSSVSDPYAKVTSFTSSTNIKPYVYQYVNNVISKKYV